jgi:MoaA/NifB/PqqE/SkfB family radical SAM enzyme
VKSKFLYIDVFSLCNLRCPSCVVGDKNRQGRPVPRGLMSPHALGKVLDKATAEFTVTGVGFFNWTEPLLHPQIANMISEVSRRGLRCWLSSNLNELRDPEAIFAARPEEIIVSVSGFCQEIYERGHAGGNIETVKRNMARLAAARAKLGAATSLKLVFHRYADNAKDEALMREYAASLGFLFNPVWAYVTSVERVMAIRSGREVYADDNALLDRLAMPFGEALDIVGQEPMSTCYHKTDRLVIDPKGQVMLCCASSGHPSNVVGDFLDEPFTEIEERMERHSLCGACMQQGLPNYFLFSETGERGFDEAAQKRRCRDISPP